ncbi:MAG TPA: tetratricopeptide repeat protein [Terriglobales bacterium]|nr:tetratricopeptide repeat protein [Terriglobales bacterium]
MKLSNRLIFLLALSGLYLYGLPDTSVFYLGIVVLHLAAGVLLALLLPRVLRRGLSDLPGTARLGWIAMGLGAMIGVLLFAIGTTRPNLPWLYAHIGLTVAGVALLLVAWMERRGWLGSAVARFAVAVLFVAALSTAAQYSRHNLWLSANIIRNPLNPPTSMDGEGDGPRGPFFPSSSQVKDGKLIPSEFFMKSDACQRCHQDIYQQWFSSAHHFSSFNNQWYRKSVEYMQEVAGTKPSKWCGGCHDPAILLAGKMDKPIVEQMDRPEAHAGMGCMMCHSIVHVKSSMGQGDFVLEYPDLHELAASENPVLRGVHDFLTYVNPEPHRRAFLKPFMRDQTAEFCSTCHKVHLDSPVNHYRWIRGFNEYDNWQASGVSGQGARSFYYPPKAQKCADCHMPLVESQDQGNIAGKVHSHRFPGANTALPTANQDAIQLEVTKKFLQDNIVSVDIFALSEAEPMTAGGAAVPGELATTFAVGEEAELAAPAGGPAAPAAPVTAPLDRVQPVVRRGETVRVDVVVRTRKVGHFFPGGTVDAFDVWLELKATDDRGRVVFWSGSVENDGKGPVEKGAHFYRSLLVDAHGNPINKRNAWAARSVVYVRLIPPGAADTVHYRMKVPEDAGGKIKLEARLHYRKFSWWNTQFSFAGVRDPAQPGPHTPDYDDGRFVFTGDTSKVSGKLKQIPDLPIVTLASDEVTLEVAPRSARAQEPRVQLDAKDWERWNDYGIGLLLQGDLKAAQAAFQKITEIDPKNPDGWVNIGRARVQEGDNEGARAVLQKALELKPDLARAHYFYARVLKADGRYDDAIAHLRKTLAQYPRDRVVRNELGRILFLKRQYADAVREFEKVLEVDPEDLQAHYNLMLCYNGLGNEARAAEHQKRYLRFKADEAAQAITGPYRQANPEDNNERQAIHEHVSAPLGKTAAPARRTAAVPAPHVRQGSSD